ncbi:hypothetical protein D3C75_1242940 [compost metagenome]
MEALMIPPAPAGIKASMPINGAKNRTSRQGISRSQPNSPLAPSSLPRSSNTAKVEKAVVRVGIMTMKVSTT